MATLSRLNDAPGDDAAELLSACCASPVWVDAMVAGRPYESAEALRSRGDESLAQLDWSEILAALAAHPRIGDRVAGAGTEAAWSRREQAGMATATDEVRAALVEVNREYEDRFGHVFLIFASGRTDTEMLTAARARLVNPVETEQAVVRAELARIVDLRLERMVSDG